MAYSIIYCQFTPCSVIYTSDRSFVQNKENGIRQIQHQIVGNKTEKEKIIMVHIISEAVISL